MKKNVFLITLFIFIVFFENCFADGDTSAGSQIIRLDDEGYLYYMEYTKNYYSSETIEAMRKAGIFDSGCSAFFTYNPEGDPITCRNYDYPHRVSAQDRTLTGLNVILHTKPEGKYESVAVADAVWCDPGNPLLRNGGPDNPEFDISLLDIIPYECMDGINEKGLFISIQRVDIKEGDQPANYAAGSSILLRYLLDDCADVSEVLDKIFTTIVTPEDWQDCHLFATDADGNYAVIESRNGEVSYIDSDAVTNFYLTYDDMEDSYNNGRLRENAVALTNENGKKAFNYGYGHGYHRFTTIVSQLRMHEDRKSESYRTVMPESRALTILQSAAQNPYTTSAGISMTQYSAIYNNADRTVKVWPFQNYSVAYEFDVTGKRIQ